MPCSPGASMPSGRPLSAVSINLSGGSMSTRFFTQYKRSLVAAAALALVASSAMAGTPKDSYLEYDGGPEYIGPDDGLGGQKPSVGMAGATLGGWAAAPANGAPSSIVQGFKGVSQYDLRAILGGSFIPPDTMGAVGATQFMETTNGVYAIYD